MQVSKILVWIFLLAFVVGEVAAGQTSGPYFASGIKIGEVDHTSAIVWVRATKNDKPNFDSLEIFTKGLTRKTKDRIEMIESVVPGQRSHVRVVWWQKNAKAETANSSKWVLVDQRTDFIHQFRLNQLSPNTEYKIQIEAKLPDETNLTDEAKLIADRKTPKQVSRCSGQFKTAPASKKSTPIKFIVTTCQAVRSIDSGAQGHIAYQKMLNARPDFFVHTGDILYYDKAPLCKTAAQARAKWNLIYGYGHNKAFHKNIASYFMKDDHDTLKNDCWPGQKYGELTFQQGLDIFREQVPMSNKTYRTFRWGKDVQIWLTENRDFRSSNRDADGPQKTILGTKQKAWLKKTITESDATFKFVISPGPIVGPDKKGKSDNHANAAFATEGRELRRFLAAQSNVYVICGDRHWQYCSQDPETGLLEMGCGPINDQHSFGGNPGENPKYHRYFSPNGGFLIVEVDGNMSASWVHANEPDSSSPPTMRIELAPEPTKP